MIYVRRHASEPIFQGDIFQSVPRVDVQLKELAIVDEEERVTVLDWVTLVGRSGGPLTVLASVKPVLAIVISQDCDLSRASDVALCEMRPFAEVHKTAVNWPATPKSWAKKIPTASRENQKWFYLPESQSDGIKERYAADFFSITRVSLEELLDHRDNLRLCGLNAVAREHFRESISEFFRRYAYDEWYPLTKDEFEEYREMKNPETPEPFEWQK